MPNDETTNIQSEAYNPSPEEAKRRKEVYDDFSEMRDSRAQRYGYFNDRTLKEFIDDSEKRLNSYVPSRETQGKEDWQSNFFHPITRNKTKALLASASSVPKTRFKAVNDQGKIDLKRGEIMQKLTMYSIYKDAAGRPEEKMFFSGWECAGKGTVIEYEGYSRIKRNVKTIKSFDVITGEIATEEKEEIVEEGCTSFIVPLLSLYIKDFYIYDIQKQPSLCWVQYLWKDDVEDQFGKYKNFKYVKTKDQITDSEAVSYFKQEWQSRVKDKQYEVIRYYRKKTDTYRVIINGVEILDAPLLWGKKKKVYPFAKTVFEIFATDFFYGNSLPNVLMGEQDVINSLYNMSLDKNYRSLVPPMLIGSVNKDDFDLEDENVSLDTKIYVSDINQVKEMPMAGTTAADFNMIKLISNGLDLSSVDATQSGAAGTKTGITAREIVIADEAAKKIKGLFFMFLEGLWIQKINIRILNILTYYTMAEVKEIVGEGDAKEYETMLNRTYLVENTELSNGSKGTLAVQIVKDKTQLPTQRQLDIDEEKQRMQGHNYEKIAMTSDYLDTWDYDFQVISETLYQQSKSLATALVIEKIKTVAAFFPSIFMANQDVFFTDLIEQYDETPDKYQIPNSQAGPTGEEQGNSQLIEGLTKTETPTLAQLSGQQ